MSRTNTQGQILEDEDKILASRPTCPRRLNITMHACVLLSVLRYLHYKNLKNKKKQTKKCFCQLCWRPSQFLCCSFMMKRQVCCNCYILVSGDLKMYHLRVSRDICLNNGDVTVQ